jgi:hypothetical protein
MAHSHRRLSARTTAISWLQQGLGGNTYLGFLGGGPRIKHTVWSKAALMFRLAMKIAQFAGFIPHGPSISSPLAGTTRRLHWLVWEVKDGAL